MLKSLYIKNFAIIKEASINFSHGLNIITGETGAGKSIIVDALMIALGGRAITDFVRYGESKAIVEAAFIVSNDSILKFLLDNDFDVFENEVLIRREINSKGGSRAFINDSPVQTALLKELGDLLVDFHGQHDHQSLLKSDYHIDLLDQFGSYKNLLDIYRETYSKTNNLINLLNSLKIKEKDIKAKEEINRFIYKEISSVSPEKDEDIKLEAELKILENSEALYNLSSTLAEILYGGEYAVHDKLYEALSIAKQLKTIDNSFEEYLQELSAAIVSIDEVSKFSIDYKNKVSFSPERVEEIRNRLRALKTLEKKYGSLDSALDKLASLQNELDIASNFEFEIQKTENELHSAKKDLASIALEISDKRKIAAEELENNIEITLKELGIDNPKFVVNIESIKSNVNNSLILEINSELVKAFSNGIDKVEFFISTNKGEEPKSLINVASGGEISRIMLSIKSSLSKFDSTPVMIFDEIDVGISGRIAGKVGAKMKRLAGTQQVIAITHLPQIAAMGDLNINVSKSESNGKTTAKAIALNKEQKLIEIAKMISGETVSDAALNNARELLEGFQN